MPQFYTDVEVDLGVNDFIDECNDKEIKELVETLKKQGHINDLYDDSSIIGKEFSDIINKIYKNRLRLTIEEDDLLKKIASRL